MTKFVSYTDSCHRKLVSGIRFSLDADCGGNSNGDTVDIMGAITSSRRLKVEETTTCALSGSRRKSNYKCKDIHHILHVAKSD